MPSSHVCRCLLPLPGPFLQPCLQGNVFLSIRNQTASYYDGALRSQHRGRITLQGPHGRVILLSPPATRKTHGLTSGRDD